MPTSLAPPRALAAAVLSASSAAVAADLPPAWSVVPERVFTTRTYTEGPVFGPDRALYASQTATGEVVRYGADGSERVWLKGYPGANGHMVLPDGTHVVMSRPDVVFAKSDGAVLDTISAFEGQPFVFPNDVEQDGDGGFWFTDSGARDRPSGAIYHVDADRNVRRVAKGLSFPNGVIALRGTLYVTQSTANDVLAFDIAPDRSLGGKRVLARLVGERLDQAKAMPDGMCLGPDERLWIAHNGTGMIRVLDPAARRPVASYRTGLLAVSNCAFGPDGALYVTGSTTFENDPGGIMRLDLRLPATNE